MIVKVIKGQHRCDIQTLKDYKIKKSNDVCSTPSYRPASLQAAQ
jgi:hypothetical protein